ncbi:MAG: hypothetical protein ACK500_13630 [Flavobacteriales bacterium]|jgi:hypothetical protein
MKPVSTFAVVCTLLAIALSLGVLFINSLTALVMPKVMYYIPFAFGLLTIALYSNVRMASAKSAPRFVAAFMSAVTMKLLLTAAFLGVYIYNFKSEKVPVALGTFVIYIMYTVLLVRYLRFSDGAEQQKV